MVVPPFGGWPFADRFLACGASPVMGTSVPTPYSEASTLDSAFFTPAEAALTVTTRPIPTARPKATKIAWRIRRRSSRRRYVAKNICSPIRDEGFATPDPPGRKPRAGAPGRPASRRPVQGQFYECHGCAAVTRRRPADPRSPRCNPAATGGETPWDPAGARLGLMITTRRASSRCRRRFQVRRNCTTPRRRPVTAGPTTRPPGQVPAGPTTRRADRAPAGPTTRRADRAPAGTTTRRADQTPAGPTTTRRT